MGLSQIAAYRKATGSKATDAAAYVEGSKWAKKPKIRLRIRELRDAIRAAATDKLVYRWEDAMAELDDAKIAAFIEGEHSAAIAAIRQKCKISGLEVDPRKNAQKPFDAITDEELDRRIQDAQREVASHGATRH